MDFENLTPEQQEKAKAAQTPEELKALAEEAEQELPEEELEAVGGGCSDQRWRRGPCGPHEWMRNVIRENT